MELAHLLYQICHEVLTITDLNAIRDFYDSPCSACLQPGVMHYG
jgi:hypothetical protein